MPPAPTRQLYINCKYMSIKKRRETTKNKRTDYCPLAVGIGIRGCQGWGESFLSLIIFFPHINAATIRPIKQICRNYTYF